MALRSEVFGKDSPDVPWAYLEATMSSKDHGDAKAHADSAEKQEVERQAWAKRHTEWVQGDGHWKCKQGKAKGGPQKARA
eukprot:2959711-Lingulodinium_polyedra.AAC.1